MLCSCCRAVCSHVGDCDAVHLVPVRSAGSCAWAATPVHLHIVAVPQRAMDLWLVASSPGWRNTYQAPHACATDQCSCSRCRGELRARLSQAALLRCLVVHQVAARNLSLGNYRPEWGTRSTVLQSVTLCCRTLPGDFAQGAGVSSLSLAGNNLVSPTRACQISVCRCVLVGPQEGGMLPKSHIKCWMSISSQCPAACKVRTGAWNMPRACVLFVCLCTWMN